MRSISGPGPGSRVLEKLGDGEQVMTTDQWLMLIQDVVLIVIAAILARHYH